MFFRSDILIVNDNTNFFYILYIHVVVYKKKLVPIIMTNI